MELEEKLREVESERDEWMRRYNFAVERQAALEVQVFEALQDLRDWFAGQAIQTAERNVNYSGAGVMLEIIADYAYTLADAMMERRKR